MAEVVRLHHLPSRHEMANDNPFLVTVMPVQDGWLTVCRKHGWLHSTRQEALADASEVAAGFGVGLLILLGRRA